MVIEVSSGELYRWSVAVRGFAVRGFAGLPRRSAQREGGFGRDCYNGGFRLEPEGCGCRCELWNARCLPELTGADPDRVAAGGERAGAALELGQRHFHGLAGFERKTRIYVTDRRALAV